MQTSPRRKVLLVTSVILLLGVFVTLGVVKQNQDSRSRAAAVVNTPGTYGYNNFGSVYTYGGSIPTTAPSVTTTLTPTSTTSVTSGPTAAPTATTIPTPTTIPTLGPTTTPFPTSLPTAIPTLGPTATPFPTALPNTTLIALDLLLQGLGSGGDNVNPQGQGNPNPLTPRRSVTIELYDAQNVLVKSQEAQVDFASSSGSFIGTASIGDGIETDTYIVKIKSNQYLKSQIPGIHNIVTGTTNTLPKIALITGDINGDNKINIVDYNVLMGCFSDLSPAVSCTTENKTLADLTDDGFVNQFDYNLFLRQISVLRGG